MMVDEGTFSSETWGYIINNKLWVVAFVTNTNSMVQPVLLVHGGAEEIPDHMVQRRCDGVKKAAMEGYSVLHKTGNVLDAIEAAIKSMENDDAFNAGKGSVLNLAGGIEMDALITEGKNLSAGSVTMVKNIAHPISLARMVMEKTPHTILGGEGAEEFIVKMGMPRVTDEYLMTKGARKALEEFKNSKKNSFATFCSSSSNHDKSRGGGTVGCVAVDVNGHVGSGTSTGGLTGKYKGRIGDSPLPGCGGYSDDDIGAVSSTGHGESILKYNLAHRVLNLMCAGQSAQEAATGACAECTRRFENFVGAIAVSNKGDVGLSFTTSRMPWAYQVDNDIHYGIEQGQHLVEKLG